MKGVAEDNSLMAEVVDDVEIKMGGISKKNRVFVANISDEYIIGLDTMKIFNMVLEVGKGMVGSKWESDAMLFEICGRGGCTALPSGNSL